MNAMLESSDKKDIFKHRKEEEGKKKTNKNHTCPACRVSSITHLFLKTMFVMNRRYSLFFVAQHDNKAWDEVASKRQARNPPSLADKKKGPKTHCRWMQVWQESVHWIKSKIMKEKKLMNFTGVYRVPACTLHILRRESWINFQKSNTANLINSGGKKSWQTG